MKDAEKKHIAKVKNMPCAICGSQPAEAHHVRTGQGMAQRAGHYLVIPLCAGCHRGELGVHGNRTMLKVNKVSELDLLDATLEKLYG